MLHTFRAIAIHSCRHRPVEQMLIKHMRNNIQNLAFTVVEMLIVMMIIVTLMSMGVGAWIGTAERSETMASQELLLSLIQQTRSRSFSQDRPLVLYFNKDAQSITGIDQEFLWHQNFDWPSADTASYVDDEGDGLALPLERSFGRTGYAWKFPYAAPGSGAQMFLAPFNCTQIDFTEDAEKYLPLFREPSDGFLLECTFKAPRIELAQSTQVPILLLSPKGTTDSIDTAIAGIELWKIGQFIDDNGASQKVGDAWAIIAWLHQRPDYPDLSSVPESDATWSFLQTGTGFTRDLQSAAANDVSNVNPYTGGSWIKTTFGYDNNTLFLFKDGKRVDTAVPDGGFTPIVNQEIDIFVGRHTRDAQRYVTEADIDDATLMSIGSSNQLQLPGKYGPAYNYKIICENGLLTCYQDNVETTTLTIIDNTTQVRAFDILFLADGSSSILEYNASTGASIP